MGDGGSGHWLVRMEWRTAWWSVCLPLLILPCTIKSRSFLLAPAHPGGPGKKARETIVVNKLHLHVYEWLCITLFSCYYEFLNIYLTLLFGNVFILKNVLFSVSSNMLHLWIAPSLFELLFCSVFPLQISLLSSQLGRQNEGQVRKLRCGRSLWQCCANNHDDLSLLS